jgi:hypothetical protein
MRPLLLAPLALILFAACGEESTAPTSTTASALDGPAASAVRANQYWERSSFTVDGVRPAACLGEDVRFFGEVPYQYHEVTSSSGNLQFIFFIRPYTPQSPRYYAQGVTSGTLYEYRKGGPIPQIVHVGPGAVQTMIDKEWYTAEDGSRIYVTVWLHMTVNANGDLVVFRAEPFSVECER